MFRDRLGGKAGAVQCYDRIPGKDASHASSMTMHAQASTVTAPFGVEGDGFDPSAIILTALSICLHLL